MLLVREGGFLLYASQAEKLERETLSFEKKISVHGWMARPPLRRQDTRIYARPPQNSQFTERDEGPILIAFVWLIVFKLKTTPPSTAFALLEKKAIRVIVGPAIEIFQRGKRQERK